MKKIFLMLLILASISFSQTGKIAGKILDKKTKDGIPGVNVFIKGTKQGTITDIEGNYFILNIDPKICDVTASLLGYGTVTKQGVIVNQNRTTDLDFLLEETIVALDKEVIISADRPDVEREKTSTSEIIRAEDVLISPGVIDLSNVLALSSEVVDGHFRGGRDGEELYTLAGMGIVNPLTSGAAFAPIMSAVEEVEVTTSGFGAQYGNAQSGVVNISMKEGRADRWQGRAELRTRMPGYKHFGPSVFDERANPYLQILNSAEGWNGADLSASGTSGSVYWSGLGGSFSSRYNKDSAQASQIAYQLWKQARRDLNKPYDNLIDYSVDFNIGGPLTNDIRLFLASFVENKWLIIPTAEPDIKRQLMGNIVYDFGDGMTMRFSGAYTNRKEHLVPGLNSFGYTSFQRWLWDRVIGLAISNEDDLQLGVRFAHAFSNSTFYEIKINQVTTHYIDGVRVADPNRYITDDQNIAVWPYYNIQDKFSTGQMDNDFRSEKTGTITFDGSITSQVNQSHQLMGGIQYNIYNIDVNNRTSLSSAGSQQNEVYAAKPFELGLFVQDKMEFEGMIAKVGLRFDLFNPNDEYYADYYLPVASTNSPKLKTVTIGRLQPRIGISFPVSISTVFHLNYGTFVQRPSFNRVLFSQVRPSDSRVLQLGNPNLKPEYTQSYDVGLAQGLGDGFTLDVSGFYKDVKNLIQQAIFTVKPADAGYRTFMNRDYADIRGFHVTLANRRGAFTGKASYSYSIATGSNSTPFNTVPRFILQPDQNSPAVELPNAKDVTLDFDRTHNLVLTLAAVTPEEWGFSFLDMYPLQHFSISLKSFARSGRPYTSNLDYGLVNHHRTPSEYNTDLKISKKVSKLFGSSTTFYIEVFNVFDQRIYSYNTVFQSASTTGSSPSIANNNASIYDADPSGLKYFTGYAPFLVDQTFLLYSNRPIEFYVGMTVNF